MLSCSLMLLHYTRVRSSVCFPIWGCCTVYLHCKCTLFTPHHKTVLILATTTRDLILFFFLGVHVVWGGNVEPSISWDIPLENSVPLPAMYMLLHYNTEKIRDFLFVFCSSLKTSENVPSGSSQPKTCVVFFLCEVLLSTILGYWYFLSFNRGYHNTSLLLEL